MDFSDNKYLNKFVGKTHILPTDAEYWNEFLQYQITLPSNR